MKVPDEIEARITSAGGKNRYNQPNFRLVWGRDRIVPFHGKWDDNGKVETRWEPKYLPFECWHLEMWRPPEEYGTRESWRQAGLEVSGGLTVDTSGPFPSMGEYELVFPLTADLSSMGQPMSLDASVCELLVILIVHCGQNLTPTQKRVAIAQRREREERRRVETNVDKIKDNMRPFCSEKFITMPEGAGKIIIP